MPTERLRRIPLLGSLLTLVGCGSNPPLPTVDQVDLDRFVGDWYVQAHIPAWGEGQAYNAVESYALGEDGRILTSYVFRKGGFDAELETMEPVGRVEDEASKATWGMRLVWPIWAEYKIAHLDADYSETIIARTKRDYVWVMTREAEISEERMARLTERVAELGYDPEKLRRVPQRWPDAGHPVNRAEGSLATWTRAND